MNQIGCCKSRGQAITNWSAIFQHILHIRTMLKFVYHIGSKLNWIMHKRVLYWIVHSAKAICVLHWKTIFYNYFRILKSNPYFLTLLKYRKAKLHNSIKYLPGPSKAIYVAKWKSLHIPKLVEILLPMDHLVFRFATRGQCIKGKQC